MRKLCKTRVALCFSSLAYSCGCLEVLLILACWESSQHLPLSPTVTSLGWWLLIPCFAARIRSILDHFFMHRCVSAALFVAPRSSVGFADCQTWMTDGVSSLVSEDFCGLRHSAGCWYGSFGFRTEHAKLPVPIFVRLCSVKHRRACSCCYAQTCGWFTDSRFLFWLNYVLMRISV